MMLIGRKMVVKANFEITYHDINKKTTVKRS